MENLTHTIVGLMLARVGLEKTTPRGAGMLMLAANAPDIDGVTWLGGTLSYIETHRTYTHSLAFLPLMALLPMLLVRARFSWRSYLASMAAVLSHLLLDWTNSYGIPLALPFSGHRFRLDTVNLVDFWIWAILVGALWATALSSRVDGEIRPASNPGARRGWAWAALLVLLAYESGRWAAHDRAIQVMASRVYESAPPRRVTALPVALHPLAWRGVIEGDGFTILVPVNLGGEYDPGAGRLYRDAPPIPALDAALRTRPFQVLNRFSQLPFWKVTPVAEGVRVELIDLRFGSPETPGFAAAAAIVDPMGKVLRAGFGL
jgi:inner membrane protein